MIVCACVLFAAVSAFRLPQFAQQRHASIASHHYYLGRKNGLHGVAMVHYHPQHVPYNTTHTTRKRQVASCTAPISPGARWKSSAGYYLHTRNTLGLSESFVSSAVARAFDRWSCALEDTLTLGPRLGVRTAPRPENLVLSEPTGENVIDFGAIEGQPGTIAVTIVWGVMSGPVEQRELHEFKMRFDQTHYRFGNATLSRVFMDLESIATHEVGHAFGLADMYNTHCEHATMFGTSRPGETKKRSIEADDVRGLQQLYGAW